MSGINRFMSPVKTQYQQTYVDQFVPMPFELMQRRAETEQKRFDEVSDYWDKLQSQLKAKVDAIDDPMNQEQIHALQSQVEDALGTANGDWRKLDNVVKNASKSWNNYINSEHGALATSNKTAMDANSKRIIDSKMSGEMKDLYSQAALINYRRTGGALTGATYENFEPSKDIDHLFQKVADNLYKLTPDKIAAANYAYEDKGKTLLNFKTINENLSVSDIRKMSESTVYADEAWRDKTTKDLKVLKTLGYIPEMTLDEYRKAVYERDFLGKFDAIAFNKHDETLNAKQTKAGELSDEENFRSPIVDFSFKNRFNTGDKGLSELSNAGNDGNKVLESQSQAIVGSTLNTVMGKLNLKPQQFNELMRDKGYGTIKDGIFESSLAQQKDFLNALISNPESIGLDLSKSMYKELSNTARLTRKQLNDNENLQLEILEEIVEIGDAVDGVTLSKEEFEAYEKSVKDRQKGIEELSNIIADPERSKEEIDAAKALLNYDDLGSTSPKETDKLLNILKGNNPTFYNIVKAGFLGTSNTSAAAIHSANNYDPSDIENLTPAQKIAYKANKIKNSNKFGKTLSNRAEDVKNAQSMRQFRGKFYIYDQQGKIDETATNRLTKDINQAFKDKRENFLNVNVTRKEGKENVTMPLREAIKTDVSLDYPDIQPDELAKRVEKRIDEIFDSKQPLSFGSTDFNEMSIGGKYLLKSGKNEDFQSTMDELIPSETKAIIHKNSIISRAVESIHGKSYITPEVTLRTNKLGVGEKPGSVSDQVASGGNYEIVIDYSALPEGHSYKKLGRDLVLGKEESNKLLNKISTMKADADSMKGYYKTPSGDYIPVEDAIKEYVKLYTEDITK